MAYEYRVAGQTVRLEIDPNYVAVKFEPRTPRSARARATEDAGFETFSDRIEIPSEGLTLIPAAARTLSPARPADGLETLSRQPEVAAATPVFRVGENKVVPTNRVIVGLSDPAALESVRSRFNLTTIRQGEDDVLSVFRTGPTCSRSAHNSMRCRRPHLPSRTSSRSEHKFRNLRRRRWRPHAATRCWRVNTR